MKKGIKIYRDFTKMPVSKKITFTNNLLTSMTGKEEYKPVEPILTDLEAKKARIIVVKVEADHGNKEAKAELRQLIAEWDFLVNKLASSVEIIAEDSEAIAVEAGFSVIGPRTKPNIPTLQSKPGLTSDTIILRRKREEGAKSYIWQMFKGQTLAPDSAWTQVDVTTTATITIDGLESASYYWFRVAVVTVDGVEEFCDPIMALIH